MPNAGRGSRFANDGLMSYSTSIYDVWRRAGSVISKLTPAAGAGSKFSVRRPDEFGLIKMRSIQAHSGL
jgi:hypothetical protein